MPSATVSKTATVLGSSFGDTSLGVTSDAHAGVDKVLAAAKTGTLTTRTDANTGTLTMVSGHGITTSAIIDLYWSGGSRRGVVVGAVSGTSVPIDLGSGDDLPAATTAITAMVVNQEDVAIVGDDIDGLFIGCNAPFTVVFLDGSDAELFSVVKTGTAGGAYIWTTAEGVTNPLAGETVAAIRTSHGASTASKQPKALALYST